MKQITILLVLLVASFSYGQVVINEIDVDQTGSDTAEFIELKTDNTNQSLNGYLVVLYNGSNNLSYAMYDLNGFTSDANGFFLLANDGVTGQDLLLTTIQNGPDAIAIYQADAANFPNGTAVTTSGLVDALVYGTGDDDDTELLAGLGETTQYDEDAFGFQTIESLQLNEDGDYCTSAPTPKATNACTTPVSTISQLRAGEEGSLYWFIGEAILTFQQDFRNQKYIEDQTGAILIDDNTGALTTEYNIGDGLTFITGLLSSSEGTLLFTPTRDSGVALTTGNPITPQIVAADVLNANPTEYQSEYVQIENTTIDNSTSTTWINEETYELTTGDGSYTFRAAFSDVDYIGTTVPEIANISGIITRDSNMSFITARNFGDFEEFLSLEGEDANIVSVFPNPASNMITLHTGNAGQKAVTIYNITGQKVIDITTEQSINVSTLSTGMYLVKVTEVNSTMTTKLIIK